MDNFLGVFVDAYQESAKQLRSEIENIRYGELGTILFEFRGETYQIEEPKDFLIVGYGDVSRAFCLKQILANKVTKL